ncbi:peptidase T [Weissella coleopterorum]|uniref:Peptidase T n=1 Tax=Weissella coleopterorum TaxID=2714949 RepID=A0A6G8B0F1_9LACO|nr:peptidase T [Weissella coleopterorum]QIL50717.1 peptidase T [Weissella coleopterorum]
MVKVQHSELLDRFLKYVRMDTRSNEASTTVPSDSKEVDFIANLANELEAIGVQNIRTMADGYLFAEIPSNLNIAVPVIGFIAHVDTADFPSERVNPQIVENYDGHSVIQLNPDYQLDPKQFPNLTHYQGDTLITTDGTTLLGADDKAGVAEIMNMAQFLVQHPAVEHGKIMLAFGPDEEIGTGADHFDVDNFNADFAYTVDGGPLGELEWETFSAAMATVKIQGLNVHPGSAKDTMVNALQVAMDYHAQLPEHDRPEHTTRREGFWHLIKLTGTPEQAQMQYLVRDHDRNQFELRKQKLHTIAEQMNHIFKTSRIQITSKDEYYNMGEILKDNMYPVELASAALKSLAIEPKIEPIRGGTDGSKITFLGLPTPNLFAGGENMHGRYEYISLQVMQKAVDTLLKISELNVLQTREK